MQQKIINDEIKRLEEEVHHLKEYLLSDCCRQCSEIILKIDKYELEIQDLKKNLDT